MKTIAIINQKGGVGKSTTAEALAAGLKRLGFKTLAVDLDAQCNLTRTAAAGNDVTILDVLRGNVPAGEAVQETALADVIAGDISINKLEQEVESTGKEYRLKEALDTLSGAYDYAIVDTPPALSFLTINALTASDIVVIPAEADIYALEGIISLAGTISAVKKYTNPNLNIAGILLTKYSGRTILTKDLTSVAENIAAQLGTKVFNSKIRQSITIREAQAMKQSIFAYAPKSKVAADYSAFIDEMIKG